MYSRIMDEQMQRMHHRRSSRMRVIYALSAALLFCVFLFVLHTLQETRTPIYNEIHIHADFAIYLNGARIALTDNT